LNQCENNPTDEEVILAIARLGHRLWNYWQGLFLNKETGEYEKGYDCSFHLPEPFLEMINYVLVNDMERNPIRSIPSVPDVIRFPKDAFPWSKIEIFGAEVDRFDFSKFVFTKPVNFEGTGFSKGVVDFSNARFIGIVEFNRSRFEYTAKFKSVVFCKRVDFKSCVFENSAIFDDVVFNDVNRGVRFTNTKFYGVTSFNDSVFCSPPFFSKVNFSHGLSFNSAKFKRGNIPDEMAEFSWGLLKGLFKETGHHWFSLDFFALQLQSRRRMEKNYFKKIPYFMYQIFSDYGRSFFRPLLALFLVSFCFSLFVFEPKDMWCGFDLVNLENISIEFFRIFVSVLGSSLPLSIETNILTGISDLVAKLLSSILLFLCLLALRNRFISK